MVLANSTIVSLFLSTGITSSFLQPVAQKLADLLENKIVRIQETGDKLRKLERTLLKIQSLIDQVEDKQYISNTSRLLIEDFKGVVLDSDDLFDKIHLQLYLHNDESDLDSATKAEVSTKVDHVDKLFKDIEVYFISEIAKPRPPQTLAIPYSSSFLDQSSVIGLVKEKAEIVKLLLADGYRNKENISVIPIVGMGGIGKTTLAQLVYNDPKVIEKFDQRMWWVCVSLEYDLIKITKLILESAKNKVCKLSNLDSIKRQMKEVMLKGKFLLVLDDMWNESPSDWVALKFLFSFAAPGSRVLVTTRSKTVSSIVTTIDDLRCFSPTPLSENDCWEVIKKSLKTKVDYREDLEAIGLELAKKCKGFPLAAKVIADALHVKSTEVEWNALLKCDLWDLPEDKNRVYQVLKLSYDDLPAYLKRCFVYYSIIPQSEKVKVEDLIQIWSAEGFIQAQGARRIEDIGREYLDKLCSRSLLHISSNNDVEMHDFIHDLARLISTNLCLRLEDTMSAKPTSFLSQNVRHLSLLCKSGQSDVSAAKLEESYRYKKLRTFMLFSHVSQVPTNLSLLQIFQKLFEKFKWLRVLNLTGSGIRKLSGLIDKLKHLRYLDLSDTAITNLPEDIVNLYALETLKLNNCTELKKWPLNFEKLVKLRHLHFERQGQMSSMPKDLGKLTSLETLHTFTVGSEEGYQIGELQNMKCLRGSINIKALEKVADSQEAEAAKLQDKQYLDKLELHWDVTRRLTDETKLHDEGVIEGLKPPARLKELKVKGYHGSRLPDWICNPLSVNAPSRQIEKLVLGSCPELVNLPSIDHLTSLKELEIYCCDKLVSLPGLPSSLKRLNISESGISKQQCEEGGSERKNVQSIPEVEIDYQLIPTAPFPML
ncbi:hypothetical protein M0R45_015799 [Rubus argutus]|uniref:NB-ARC domain-containing protein n=1 Tax=Rubus argutus TaxID=59490 RepID=A0AAW1XT50_RUBAR